MSSTPFKRRLKVLGIGVFAVVLVLVLVEFILQFAALSSLVASDPGVFIDPKRLQQSEIPRMIPDPALNYRPNPGFHEHDTRGYRNAVLPESGEVDMVALGDSQTYGMGVNRPEAWPQVLAAHTDWRSYNLAFGGYGPAHYLLLLNEALALKPRLVIAAVYTGNDLFETFHLVYGAHYAEALTPSDQPQVREAIKHAQEKLPVAPEGQRRWRDPADKILFSASHPGLGWFARSQLYQAGVRLRWWAELKGRGFDFCRPDSGNHFGEAVAGAAESVLTPRYRHLALDLSDPRIREGLRLAQQALRLMDQRSRRAGARFMVMLIPTKEQVYAPWMRARTAPPPAAYERMVQDEHAVLQMLEAYLNDQGIAYFSALPALRQSLRLGLAPYRAGDDGHPAPDGQRAIAQCLAVFLEQEMSWSPRGP